MKNKEISRKQILNKLSKVYSALDVKVFTMMTFDQLSKFYSQQFRV